MADDGSRDREDASLYFNLAKAYKQGDEKEIAKWKAKIEKQEGSQINEEQSPLYSDKKGKVVSFAEKIMEMNANYEDLMFDLAENSNERIKDLKQMRAGEVIRFNQRVIEKLKRQAKKK